MEPMQPYHGLKACWQEPKLSDIRVFIIESSAAVSFQSVEEEPNKQEQTSGGEEAKHVVHYSKVLLAAHSDYFRARLLSGLEDGAQDFPLIVEEGEADAALSVIRSMYTGSFGDATTADLVVMWKVADRLQASSAALCVKALCAMDLDWETAIMVRKACRAACTACLYVATLVASCVEHYMQ